ncbi:hypothetical protein ACFXAF_32825 [Kitasatospora sp. NPDC059463]|uniref:hypothetical protein n=3 Tax=Kitasatospora TaxID=2063 RepID=UPI0036AC3A11
MNDERRPAADGEHGGGPGPSGESPVERLLREAMAARVARITTQDLRPADPPSGPRTRRRPAYLVGLPLMGLAAATVIGLLSVPGDTLADKGDDTPAATMSSSADPSPGPDPLAPAEQSADPLGRPAGAPAPGVPQDPGSAFEPDAAGAPGTTGSPGGAGAGRGRPVTGAASPQPGGPAAGTAGAGDPTAAGGGVARPSQGIVLSFDGLEKKEATVGAGPVTFAVTWHNTTEQAYGKVAPVVAVRSLAAEGGEGRSLRGRLQREDDGGSWTDVPLTEASGNYLASGDEAAFALAPGASRTLRYRLDPSIDSAEGTLLIEALALTPATPQRTVEASVLTALRLSEAPAAARMAPEFTVALAKDDGGADPQRATFTMTVRNPGAAPLASVLPTVLLSGTEAGSQITVQAGYGTEGRRSLPVTRNQSGLRVVDTSLLERLVRPHESTTFSFWLSVPEGWSPDPGSFAVVVGAKGDGREAAPVVVHPSLATAGR